MISFLSPYLLGRGFNWVQNRELGNSDGALLRRGCKSVWNSINSSTVKKARAQLFSEDSFIPAPLVGRPGLGRACYFQTPSRLDTTTTLQRRVWLRQA